MRYFELSCKPVGIKILFKVSQTDLVIVLKLAIFLAFFLDCIVGQMYQLILEIF